MAGGKAESPSLPSGKRAGLSPRIPMPLLAFPPGCRIGILRRRVKRFIIECSLPDGRGGERPALAHSNNSGSMLGLTRPGSLIFLSPAANPARKLPWTLELVRLPEAAPMRAADGEAALDAHGGELPPGLWVGVNTMTPNRLLRAAFEAGRLPWARGYTSFRPEAARGGSRLDALLTGPGLPDLWVECKNVTLAEDGEAAFPDAVTERGRKHLEEMAAVVRSGARAAFFYCIQRPDAACFGPADYVDPVYADTFRRSLGAGVEVHPHRALLSRAGVDLGPELPLRVRPH